MGSSTADPAIPTPWRARGIGAEFDWFKSNSDVKDALDLFCKSIRYDSKVIGHYDPGEPDDTETPGVCETWYPPEGEQYTLAGYGLLFGIAYDVLGCKPDDEYRDGITFRDWSPDGKCRETMMDNIVDKCTLKDKDKDVWHDEKLGIDKEFDTFGGIFWQDCMRFTVVAVPPDTVLDTRPNVDGHFVPPDVAEANATDFFLANGGFTRANATLWEQSHKV